MESEAFFKALQHQFNKQLPFVAYIKPESNEVKALLQPGDEIFYADDFSESGFVFAPFDSNNQSIMLPLSECEVLTLKDAGIPTESRRFCLDDEKSIKTIGHLERSQKVMVLDKSKEDHINLVQKGVATIKKGQFNKVVLSRMETVELSNSNPIDIFKQLLLSYKTAFVYCWFHPKVGLWLGATPETLIKVNNNKFETMALAGTQEYKRTVKVTWQEKERQEQQFVTDFILENLKAYVKNIHVSEVKTVKAGLLLHLKTDISGTLNPKQPNLKQVLKLLHPTPAVCGLPKEIAKQFILENESYDRQYYTGFLGEINIENTSNLFVNLRCMQLLQNQALIYVGGGITKDSNPEAEWQETVNKSQTMISILS